MTRILASLILLLVLSSPSLAGQAPTDWADTLGSIPIQHEGRTMPLDSYARGLASQLTGREKWSAGKGPEAYSGRQPIQLLCDLMFRPQDLIHKPIIGIENRPFKKSVGLDSERIFFSPTELVACKGIDDILQSFAAAKDHDPAAKPDKMQTIALAIQDDVMRISSFTNGSPLPIIPAAGNATFGRAGFAGGDPGTEPIRQKLLALRTAYLADAPLDQPVADLAAALSSAGSLDASAARGVRLEFFYNHHRPWRMAAIAYGLAIVLFGVSTLTMRRPLQIAAALATLWGVGEQVLGLYLRIVILGRAPVSNTYEALLWMGLVGVALGLVGQIINRKAWYLFAGVAMAELSVIFAHLVPLETQTNALPAVLRSNYWLIIHVLTIVASYGILGVASLLGHVYLVKEVLLKRRAAEPTSSASHPLIVQTYRSIQIGLFLLTAGTILGGVWAADSWGRFWGWDPKETWALISIIVYFVILHARYVRWLRDFGMAAAAVLSFAVIVWTFYGVNYLMASGLHSYGFGSGGGLWVAVWAGAEILFVSVCRLRFAATRPPESTREAGTAPSTPRTA